MWKVGGRKGCQLKERYPETIKGGKKGNMRLTGSEIWKGWPWGRGNLPAKRKKKRVPFRNEINRVPIRTLGRRGAPREKKKQRKATEKKAVGHQSDPTTRGVLKFSANRKSQ